MSTLDHDPEQTTDLAVHTVGRLSHSSLLGVDLLPAASDAYWEIVLHEPLVVSWGDECHVVGDGFRFDGASIRYRYVNALIQRYGRRILIGAAVHDWYYSDGRHLIPSAVGDRRLWADRLLYAAWRAAGVNVFRAQAGYRTVRLLGGMVWRAGETAGFDRPSTTKETLAESGLSDYTRIAA